MNAVSPLEEIFTAARIPAGSPERGALAAGLRAALKCAGVKAVVDYLSESFTDYLTATIDEKISAQVNAVLHHPDFLALEALWRGLRFLTDRIDFTQNIILEYLNISKEDLLNDFHDSPEIVKSGLYRLIYTSEFGQFGGRPVGAVIAGYTLGPGPQDVQLMQYVSAVACLSHAPFFAAAGMEFFGVDAWARFPDLADVKSIFDMPRFERWNAFRETENARYLGLTLPGFLLRLPYDGENAAGASSFNFIEQPESEDDFCWGNTAFAVAVCLADSFARYRWCVNIIGPDGGGAVQNLPCCRYQAMGGIQNKIPTRAVISEHREFEVAELGFIALAPGRTPHEAVFYSADSALKPKPFPKTPEGFTAEISFRLSTQFPYMMIMNRLAHYIKVLQRESIGAWKGREEISRELNKWISGYVTEMDTPDALTRSRRPLRAARVEVKEIPGSAGWYDVTILARPHFKYMGVSFTLSLEGRLDRNEPVEPVVYAGSKSDMQTAAPVAASGTQAASSGTQIASTFAPAGAHVAPPGVSPGIQAEPPVAAPVAPAATSG
ncbi:MAG: type VI secretion system contractile sheath large subunit [Desulfovibrio sp.]|jgi:type VI secretion system protein ImpC|nr:type VI secretion system contractile sheath large subunit [Desulfovibrio sp.]